MAHTLRMEVENELAILRIDRPHGNAINDELVTDTQEETNRAEGGIVEGPIVIQIHGGNRWVQAGFWRWRNIGIKELP